MKFLGILLIVFGVIFIGIMIFLKFIRNTLVNLFSPLTKEQKKEEDVLYRNDDVVVLKGEAKDKNKKKKSDV